MAGFDELRRSDLTERRPSNAMTAALDRPTQQCHHSSRPEAATSNGRPVEYVPVAQPIRLAGPLVICNLSAVMMLAVNGYDVIGDVHGRADKLVGLLRRLGYRERQGVWRHPERTAMFVGDLIDRGSQQRESIRIPRAMVEAGSAQIVLGNHEFNAVAYMLWDDERSDFRRTRVGRKGESNHKQHRAFIEQIGLGTAESRDVLVWFRTIPLWLDLGGLRVVHTCWNRSMIEHLRPLVGPTGGLTDQLVIDATTKKHPTYDAVETIVKGPEIDLGGRTYVDKGDDERRKARVRWWKPDATTLRSAALIPAGTKGTDGKDFPLLPDDPIRDATLAPYTEEIPVIVGHYWESGTPTTKTNKVACVDYSAGKGGALVAYRWSGETELDDANFVSF